MKVGVLSSKLRRLRVDAYLRSIRMKALNFAAGAVVAALWITAAFVGDAAFVADAAAEDAKPVDSAAAAPVSYAKQVLPIFREHCQGCHQPAMAKGEYVMTRFDALAKGGESGDAAIVAGKPDESHLLKLITPEGGKAEMPKDKPALAEPQIALIRRWIAEGAKDDSMSAGKPTIDAEHPPKYETPPVITALDYSPDGELLAVSGYHEVLLHDAAKLQAGEASLVRRLVGLSERIESVRFSPDGTKLAVTGGQPGRMGEVQIWNVADGKLDLSLPVTFDTVYGASWSPDGKAVAFGCADNTIRAIEAATGKQILFNLAHSDWVLGTAFSTKGTHLITVSRDMTMKLIEVPTQRFVDNLTSITPGALKGGLGVVECHPTKDELLCAGSDGEPKLYKMDRDKARQIGDDYNLIRKYAALPGRVYAARFSRDGTRVVAGSSLDGKGEVRIYDTANAQLVGKNTEQGGGVYALAFSPDGKIVAAGGFDGAVRLLDAANGKEAAKVVPVPIAAVQPVVK
jgi:mono/diheme cytochrome c family protein/DNA-binding beta-propeller fold protein YncE